MLTLLLGTALAQTPPEPAIPLDEPSSRHYDWERVHHLAIARAHSGQVWGLAAITAWAVGWGLGYAYEGDDGPLSHPAAVALVGSSGALVVLTTSVVAGSSLRARRAVFELGGRPAASAGPGYVAWSFAGVSGALFIAWGVHEGSGRPTTPVLPLFAGLAGVGAWTAGTIQVAVDHQAKGELDLHPAATLYVGPGRLSVVF
jgi:hypothetical protein